jgi:hypothetical protein
VKTFLVFFVQGLLLAQAQVKPVVRQQGLNEQVNVVRLAPRYATAIKMPEAVSSVIVGDPAKFLAEHADKEPTLVLVKPVVEEPAESNLLVTTVKGRQVSFVLRSEGSGSQPVDFLLIYKPVGSFLVEESDLGSAEVPGTEKLRTISTAPGLGSVERAVTQSEDQSEEQRSSADSEGRDLLDQLLERQRRASLPVLYGMRAPTQERKGDPVRVGVSEVVDEGRTVVVLFSMVNPQRQAIEILPPQIQLAGKVRKGFIIRRSRWGTSEQLPVADFRLSRRRLGTGERADGVVVFTRPNFKQSNESVFLQVAESGAVDRPALAPIGFGISAVRKEARHGE